MSYFVNSCITDEVIQTITTIWPLFQALGFHELLHVIRNRDCMHHSASKLILVICIIIDVKNKKLLHSITATAKSSEKMKGDK